MPSHTAMIEIPEPALSESSEQMLWRLMEKGFAANRWRPDYEEWTQQRLWAEKYQEKLIKKIRRHVLSGGTFENLRVLDLGTGRGGLSVALALVGARVTAVDLRHRNCRILHLRGSRYGFCTPAACSVGEALPFTDGSFDLVICKDVTEHCRSPRALLSEIRRVLATNGCTFVTFINRLSWIDPHYHLRGVNFVPRAMAEIIIRLAGRSKESIRDQQLLSDMHYYTLGAAKRLTREVGFTYEDVSLARMIRSNASRVRQMAHRRLSLGPSTFEAVLRPI